MTLRLNGATSGFVEIDAPPVGDGQRYQVPDDLGIPAGAVMPFAGNVAPAGWLKANGATVSRTTYPKLWAWAQGSGNLAASEGAKAPGQFGPGNGSSTFSLPDLRGEFVRGLDEGRGVDSGRAIGTSQADELKSHSHLTPTTNALAGIYEVGTGTTGYDYGEQSAPTGTTGGSETRPRNVALLFCIKH